MKTLIAIIFSFLLINSMDGQSPSYEEVLVLEEAGKYKKALSVLEEVMLTNGPIAYQYRRKSTLFFKTGKVNLALAVLEEGIDIMPDSLSLYDLLGSIYVNFKRFDKAIDVYQQAYIHSRNPKEKADYLALTGGVLNGKRAFKQAKNALERAILLDSTNLDIYNNLAHVYKELGNPEESLKQLKRIISINPDYIQGYSNIGFVLQESGYYEESLPYFDHVINMESADSRIYGYAFSNRSVSKLKLNDLEGAMEDVNKAINYFPSNSYAYKTRALIYIEKGKTKAACKDLQKAIDWNYTEEYGPEVEMLQAQYCK